MTLCTLCMQWLSPAATCGGGVSSSAIGANTSLAYVVVSPIGTSVVVHYLQTIGADSIRTLEQLALCGGGLLHTVDVCGGGGCT